MAIILFVTRKAVFRRVLKVGRLGVTRLALRLTVFAFELERRR